MARVSRDLIKTKNEQMLVFLKRLGGGADDSWAYVFEVTDWELVRDISKSNISSNYYRFTNRTFANLSAGIGYQTLIQSHQGKRHTYSPLLFGLRSFNLLQNYRIINSYFLRKRHDVYRLKWDLGKNKLILENIRK